MEERRKDKRRRLMFYSRLYDLKTGRMIGYLADLTTSGAMVISEEPIEVGINLRLRLDLPDEFAPRHHLDFEAQSRWRQPDVDPKFYTTGFQIVNLAQEDLSVVDQIIQNYGFRD